MKREEITKWTTKSAILELLIIKDLEYEYSMNLRRDF